MKNPIVYFFLVLLVLFSCSEKETQEDKAVEKFPIAVLPFQSIPLDDMSAFNKAAENWQIAKEVYVNRIQKNTISANEGSGVLVNIPTNDENDNLVTAFEHGDIEFECDVMMPVNSNSGIYFQSRYEVQLFDSWGVTIPKHSDMGGIYQRWDKTKGKGQEGFEGYAPRVNAAKSPGLWQHLKVIFHAPDFDDAGNKIKNAWFEEVRLNGALIHENIEVTGPTRGGIDGLEEAKAPLLFQGDHGPVAFRNIKYKLYESEKVELLDVIMKEYESSLALFPNLDSLVPIREVQTDSISATMVTGVRPQKLLRYIGKLRIPKSGDYLFDYKLNRAGGTLLIDNDTVISMNGNYNLDSLRVARITLKKGEVPFELVYNKHVPWQIGFGLFVEGPGIKKQALHGTSSLHLPSEEINPDFMIIPKDEPITQRGFWMHEGNKRTHCIAVGHPEGVHYTYDLESGTLLQAWSGAFMDATKMWQGRGEKQLGVPAGFIVSLHGDPEFSVLQDEKSTWPSMVSETDYRQLGYEFDLGGFPVFKYEVNGSKVSNKFIPLIKNRGLKREITIDGSKDIWFKVADGANIQKLPDGTFVVNNESYFVDFNGANVEPIIRNSRGVDELLVKITSGKQQLEYNIIW